MEIDIQQIFGSKEYDSMNNRIRCLRSVKSGIAYKICYNYAKMKVDTQNSLPLLLSYILRKTQKTNMNYPKTNFRLEYKFYIMIEQN